MHLQPKPQIQNIKMHQSGGDRKLLPKEYRLAEQGRQGDQDQTMWEDQLRYQSAHLRSENRTVSIIQNAFKKREKVNKENNHALIEKKGV